MTDWRTARAIAARLAPVTIDPAWLRDERYKRLARDLTRTDDATQVLGPMVLCWCWCAAAADEYRGDRGADDRVIPVEVLDQLWGRQDVLSPLVQAKLAHRVTTGGGVQCARLLAGPYYVDPREAA